MVMYSSLNFALASFRFDPKAHRLPPLLKLYSADTGQHNDKTK